MSTIVAIYIHGYNTWICQTISWNELACNSDSGIFHAKRLTWKNQYCIPEILKKDEISKYILLSKSLISPHWLQSNSMCKILLKNR
jgi:hypothetical protein